MRRMATSPRGLEYPGPRRSLVAGGIATTLPLLGRARVPGSCWLRHAVAAILRFPKSTRPGATGLGVLCGGCAVKFVDEVNSGSATLLLRDCGGDVRQGITAPKSPRSPPRAQSARSWPAGADRATPAQSRRRPSPGTEITRNRDVPDTVLFPGSRAALGAAPPPRQH